jgi:hypothetical protein
VLAEGNTPPAFAVADLNGDGSPDVAVLGEDEANFAATVTPFQNVYPNSPGFTAQPDFDLGTGTTTGGALNAFAIVAGQFRSAANSALPDLALVLPEGITLLENQGNFQFTLDANCQGVSTSPATNCYLAGSHFPGFSSTSPTRPAVIAADLSGNGVADIVLAVPEYCNANDSGGVKSAIYVLSSNGDGTFQLPVYYPSPVVNPVGLAAGKLLGGSGPDLVVVDGGEVCTGSQAATGAITGVAVALLPNVGDGAFGTPQTVVSQGSDVALPDVSAVAVADMNGDGAPDVVLSSSDGIHVLLNTPGNLGTFNDQGAVPLYAPNDIIENAAQIDIADFNGDGVPDVAATINGIVYFFLGTGNGGLFIPQQAYASGPNSGQVKAVDVNGDGSPDILVSNSQGFAVVLNSESAPPPPPPPASTSTQVTSSADPSSFGQRDTFYATVSSTAGIPTGAVTFYDGSTNLGQATTNTSGVAGLSTSSLNAGSHSITATYGGNSNFAGSTSSVLTEVVNQATTTAALASSASPSYLGQMVTFTATVMGELGGPVTGNVAFKDGTATVGLVGGQATYSTTYTTTGVRSMTAVYSGDGNNLTSTSAVLKQVVDSLPAETTTTLSTSGPSLINQLVTFTATVTSTYGVPDSAPVTFSDGTTELGSTTTAGGVAMFQASSLTAKTHTIKAVYAGDTTFKSSFGSVKQVVGLYAATVIVTASPNPSAFGQSVGLVATVTSAAPGGPTGTVTFKSGSTTLGTASLTAGTAALATTKLPVGVDAIVATYNGDAQDGKITSAPFTQMVNQATISLTLTSSLNPSPFGKTVKFTATLTSNGSLPSGSGQVVIFGSNDTTLGTGNIAGGKAVFSTATLPSGFDQVTATYAGSGDYSSASASVTQNVH